LHQYTYKFHGGVQMSKVIEAKKQQVEVIADQLKESVSTVLVDYRGLTVSEMTELRKNLREAGVEFKVYKNTMTRRAAEAAELTELNEFLTGPNAIAFSNEDVIAPAKVLHNFSKDHEALEIKAGVIEGSYAPAEDVKAIASLPSKDGLVSMLLSVLQAPVRNFAYAVKAIGEDKENEEA
jgi:large subunit ribosomal protein L10